MLRDVLRREGVPLAVYRDRHGSFERREQDGWTLEEELARARHLTQVGRALAELGNASIAAHSPPVKGRIERLWGTWQDRLVKELRLAAATTLEVADRVLQAYLSRYRRQFGLSSVAATCGCGRRLPRSASTRRRCC